VSFRLAITPTECTTKSINKVLDHLLRIENYEPFYLDLTAADKKFFKTTAVEQGFSALSLSAALRRSVLTSNGTVPPVCILVQLIYRSPVQDTPTIR
jgi:hypothetical protein